MVPCVLLRNRMISHQCILSTAIKVVSEKLTYFYIVLFVILRDSLFYCSVPAMIIKNVCKINFL